MAPTRKSALALAGAVTGTLAAASVAGAVNLGLLSSDSGSADPLPLFIEQIDDASPTSGPTVPGSENVEVIFQDVFDLPAQTPGPGESPAGSPVEVVGTSGSDDDDDDRADEPDELDEPDEDRSGHGSGEPDHDELDDDEPDEPDDLDEPDEPDEDHERGRDDDD